MKRLALLAFSLGLVSCQCGGLDLTQQRFACTTTADCLEGRSCVAGECVSPDGGPPPVDAGIDAGTKDAGPEDAGVDAGPEDAGTEDAGFDAGVDAGTDAGFDAGVDAGQPQGGLCSTNAQCTNNRCVDGRCCNSLCGTSCDFCNVAGSEGTCTTGALGRAPSPACPYGFACNGASAACVTTCSSDAGCVNARCDTNACVQKVSALKDDFNAQVLDASTWGAIDNNCSINNNQFQVVTPANTGDYYYITSDRVFDLTSSDLRIELVDAGNQSLASLEMYTSVCQVNTFDRCVAILASNNKVQIEINVAGMYSSLIGPFDFSNLRRFRIRESASTLYLDVQSDAGTYVELGSAASPAGIDLRAVRVRLGAGAFAGEMVPSAVSFDNLNVP